MEYLTLKTNNFNRENNYMFDCFDILQENIDINYFYNYLNSLIEYKLKNILNTIISRWEDIRINYLKLKSIDSEYYQQSYKYIHEIITYEDFNKILNIFISKDKFKALFCLKCILKEII